MTENDLMKAILDNDTIVLNEINPQEYVFKINSDNDKYVYSSRLKEAYDAGYNLVAVKCFEKKITEDEVEFYVNNEQNVFNKMSLFDFLEEASKYENMYVIITGVTENIGKLYDKLSVEYPKLCSISIPVVYSFSDYYNLKRYGTNIPILSLDRLGCSKSELMSFISSNDVFACLTTVSDDNIKFNYEFSEVVSKAADIFTYADEVNNSSEEIYYKDKYIKGFFTTNK
ncbi:MAG: hypothetical protein MJ246_04415 [Clostridia bacterium]|nr:hypothetical protein [Clostridia bacterium]